MKFRIAKCPSCGEELTYERGFAGIYGEPLEPAALFCEFCEWEADLGELEDYLDYEGDRD